MSLSGRAGDRFLPPVTGKPYRYTGDKVAGATGFFYPFTRIDEIAGEILLLPARRRAIRSIPTI